ncbi:MAG: DUF3240 family protein [Robiginitomaculum sp.]|nr:DUF3240 family protein [Robiginitomaculum sp.]
MKNLVIIIHANGQQDMSDLLRGLEVVPGFTFTRVEGHGAQSEQDMFLSARDKVVGFIPRMRVDILLADNDVETVLTAVRDAPNGGHFEGVYWCLDVEQSGRL